MHCSVSCQHTACIYIIGGKGRKREIEKETICLVGCAKLHLDFQFYNAAKKKKSGRNAQRKK